MIVRQIGVENFRNIENSLVEFTNGVNLLLGNNAQGKTNMLEAIYMMASGKSFRTPHDKDLIKFGEKSFIVNLLYEDSKREQSLYYKINDGRGLKKRECRKNGVEINKISEFIGNFRAVLFTPDHLQIIKYGPSERRNFLDVALCQLKPLYLKSLQRAVKIINERNILLKEKDLPVDTELLDVYSEQFARESAFIYKVRCEYIKRLDTLVKEFFLEMSSDDKESPEISRLEYKNSLQNEDLSEEEAFCLYYELLKSNYQREISAGITLYGPHRDDIEIYLNDKEARKFASQGQQRSISLALKLGEGEISKEYSGEYPVFLFDDVLSELDLKRQEFMMSRLENRQVIMTGCTKPPINSNTNVIFVNGGKYQEYRS